eukprot:m.112056 g.112056  ORF g.112056 m.112056 type:complete len:74 (+) comp12776_c3_seq7:217-438(+)
MRQCRTLTVHFKDDVSSTVPISTFTNLHQALELSYKDRNRPVPVDLKYMTICRTDTKEKVLFIVAIVLLLNVS